MRAAEVVSASTGTLYVVAHSNIYFRRFETDPGVRCDATPVSSREGLSVSSTVLRRMDQVTLNRSVDLLAAFYNVPNDVFFIGYEVGQRKCGGHVTGDATISLWAVPSARVRGSHNGRTITFNPGTKYLYYFDPVEPCLYEGNPAETGSSKRLDNRVSAVSGSAGDVNPSGAVITSSGEESGTAASTSGSAAPPAAPPVAPASPSPSPAQLRTAKDNPECILGSSMLEKDSGAPLSVVESRVGDFVASGYDDVSGAVQYSRIYAFSHADRTAISATPLVVITTAANLSLTLTQGHLVPVREASRLAEKGRERSSAAYARLVAASEVRERKDAVFDARLFRWVPVSVVRRRSAVGRDSGLYNPHTEAGSIIVDGIVVSCYTTAVSRWQADIMLAFARLVYIAFGEPGAEVVGHAVDLGRAGITFARRRVASMGSQDMDWTPLLAGLSFSSFKANEYEFL